jgi:hypothetical protein
MQIVDYVPHERYKITVFKSGSRFIAKFDDGDHDLSLKFREGEASNLGDVKNCIDAELLTRVGEAFSILAKHRLKRIDEGNEDYFDII